MYSLLGSLRAVIQSISYEISFILLVLIVIIIIDRFNLLVLFRYQKYFKFIYLFNLVMLIFFVSILSELNRTPFDFAEGESELVSGFNIEYMGGGFALIFMSEYGIIILIRF